MAGDSQRFWELDLLRGIAIVMMIAYHVLFDLVFFGIVDVDLHSAFIWAFARSVPIIFITVSGVCLAISYSRTTGKIGRTEREIFLKYIKRGLWILSWGVLITVITWIFLPEGFIVFGILHFFGLAMIISYPFLRKDHDYLLLAGITIVIGGVLLSMRFSFPWLMWLGFAPADFYSIDYFPILPWIGFMFTGIHIGKTFYKDGKRGFELKDRSDNNLVRFFMMLGRRSLFIYLVHQLAILGVIYLILM